MSPEFSIVLYVACVISLFLVKSAAYYLFLLAVAVILLARVPFSSLKRGWVPISFFLFFTFLSNLFFSHGKVIFSKGWLLVTEEGLYMAFIRTLRLFLMIAGAKALASSTSLDVLVKSLGRALKPLEKTGLPVDDFLNTMGLTLTCFPKLKDYLSENYRNCSDREELKGFIGRIRIISSFLMPMFIQSMKSPEMFFEADIEKD